MTTGKMTAEKVALFLGRFQPFHLGHLGVVKRLSRQYSRVIIAIGSSQLSRTVDNPFSFAERKRMITLALKEAGIRNYAIIAVPDIGNHAKWVSWTEQCAKRPFHVVYTGNAFVANLFRKAGYTVRIIKETKGISATRIRERMAAKKSWKRSVPASVAIYLRKYLSR